MTFKRCAIALVVFAAVLGASAPASADITGFLGLAGGPSVRATKGLSAGLNLVIVGAEFEYSDTSDDIGEGAPHLRTFMMNGLIQTPVPVMGVQFYGTVGAGVYHEDLASLSETSLGVNLGGGVKVKLAGPLFLRADYRVFRLAGSPIGDDVVHRVYVGATIKF